LYFRSRLGEAVRSSIGKLGILEGSCTIWAIYIEDEDFAIENYPVIIVRVQFRAPAAGARRAVQHGLPVVALKPRDKVPSVPFGIDDIWAIYIEDEDFAIENYPVIIVRVQFRALAYADARSGSAPRRTTRPSCSGTQAKR
jgi:hypothetical protein